MIQNNLKNIKKLKNEPIILITIIIIFLLFSTFIIWPVIKVFSFTTLKSYMSFLTTHRWYTALEHSVFMTVISTVTCTFVAFIFAYTAVRCSVPLKKLFKFVSLLPVLSPPFIIALSYILLFGGQGIITKQIMHIHIDIYGWQGLWFVQTITFFPFAYTIIYGVLKAIPYNLEYAASNLGATKWQVFIQITWPLCRPGIAGGALIAAINVLTDFGNPIMIGGNYTVLPTEAYMQMVGWGDLPSACTLVTILLIPAVILFAINKYWVSRRSYVIVTGKESGMGQIEPHPAVKWSLFSFCVIFSLVVLSVYSVLFYGSFAKLWGYNWSPTIENFKNVFKFGGQIYNSIVFAFFSALFASLIALILAYIVQKKHTGLDRILDFLAIIPGAVPGIFLGLGFAVAFNEKPLFLTNTSAIMIIALTFWNLPNCYTSSLAALHQISNTIEEASLNLGGNSVKTFINIILPLLKVPFLSGMTVAFLRSVTCLSVIIFIYSINTVVGTISIVNFVQDGEWGVASAITVVLISTAFIFVGIVQLILKSQHKSLEL